MDPAVWGPACWRLVFTACYKLPRSRCLDLFEALRYVLPCVHCRQSYRMYLQRLPPATAIDSTPLSAARFAWTVKDYVNGKLDAGALPFSLLCTRHEVFASPVSRMDIADLLCCMATQVSDTDQVAAYEIFAGVMDDLVRACGETMELHLPLEDKFTTPATLWLHAMQVKNTACAVVGAPTLTRSEMLARYRREAPPSTPAARTPRTPAAKAVPTRTTRTAARRPRRG